jgi:hypothetical protein
MGLSKDASDANTKTLGNWNLGINSHSTNLLGTWRIQDVDSTFSCDKE